MYACTRINQSTERAGRKDVMSELLRYGLKECCQSEKEKL